MNDDDLKNRLKGTKWFQNKESDDLFRVWATQRRMQAQDKKIEAEIKAAKKKAKALKKALKRHRLGEPSRLSKHSAQATQVIAKKLRTFPLRPGLGRKKNGIILFILVGVCLVGGIALFRNQDSNTTTETLGDTTTTTAASQDLPREKPGFEMLYPAGSQEDKYDVAKTSRPEAAPSYTYLDRFTPDGAIFRVTQQEIPDNFDLKKAATDFQATSVIQIDDLLVYHGYSEMGGVQSLIFTKANKLILIRSPQKFSDDQWASYVLSLE